MFNVRSKVSIPQIGQLGENAVSSNCGAIELVFGGPT